MTRRPIILYFIALLAVSAVSFAAIIGIVSPLNAFVNVRGQAGNTTLTPIGRIDKGTSAPVCSTVIANGEAWYGLCGGGYVSGAVVRYETITPARTPTPTVRATGTGTLKPPTRIPSSTPIPDTSADPPILMTAITDEDGYTIIPFYCPESCEGWIIVRPLK